MKYLYSPAFQFTELFLKALNSYFDENKKRVMVYPVANGLRLRTLDMRKHAIIEVSGKMVYIDWEETVEVDEMMVPFTGNRSIFCHTDHHGAAEKVDGFFNGLWEIEKDI